eukprot:750635-Hanusia_phi.AAC.4
MDYPTLPLPPAHIFDDYHPFFLLQKQRCSDEKSTPPPSSVVSRLTAMLIRLRSSRFLATDEQRQAFASSCADDLSSLLSLPLGSLLVHDARPGSPVTVITLELAPGAAARWQKQAEMVQGSSFDSSVLDVGIQSSSEESAEALTEALHDIVGKSVPVYRIRANKTEASKGRKVEFGGDDTQAKPAYLRSKEELEETARRQGGALVADKETAEYEEPKVKKYNTLEAPIKEEKPVLSYDRRLPKNAKTKQHLLHRIHTIESTLQRLYGKLDADTELPEIADIEQIMSATIKQTVHAPDPGAVESSFSPAKIRKGKEEEEEGQDSFVLPNREDEYETAKDGFEVDSNATQREKVRAERRKRMEEREKNRTMSLTQKSLDQIQEDEAVDLSRTAPAKLSKRAEAGEEEEEEEEAPRNERQKSDLKSKTQGAWPKLEDPILPADPVKDLRAIQEEYDEDEPKKEKAKAKAKGRSEDEDAFDGEEDYSSQAASRGSEFSAVFTKVRLGVSCSCSFPPTSFILLLLLLLPLLASSPPPPCSSLHP